MKKRNLKKIGIYLSAIVILFTVISCPDPITEEVVAKVEDTGSPSIEISSPLNNSVYRSSVSFTGKVKDDADNSIEKFSFKIQNRPIGGGVIINSGNVSQDSSVGDIPVTYDSDSGSFSFTFSTISPDILKDSLYVDFEAVDWNGNTANSTIVLYENRDGEYVNLISPTSSTVYSSVLSIDAEVMDQQVSAGEPIAYENLKVISYKIIGQSILEDTLVIEGATPDGSGNINTGGDLNYNTNTGQLTGNISLGSQSGTLNFQFTVTDLNGHEKSESFNISDGNVSPAVVIDSVYPPEFKGTRYFKEGAELKIEGHVGPTNRDYDLFNYYADPGTGGAAVIVDITPSVTVTDDLKLYEFKEYEDPIKTDNPVLINTTGFNEPLQRIKFQFQATGSSETSLTTVFLTPDYTEPSFVIPADPVTSDTLYYYIEIDFSEPVWGAEDFSALLLSNDFSVTNTYGPLWILGVDTNVTDGGSLEDGLTKVKLIVPKSFSNIYKDGITQYSVNTAGTSGSRGIYDVANNTPSAAGTFVFPDETEPSVVSLSPSDNGTEVALDSNIVATFSETVTVEADKVMLYKSDGTEIASSVTVVDNNKVTINPNTNLDVNTEYYVTIASDAVMDSVNNYFTGISGAESWNFTTIDPPDLTGLSPSDDASEVAVGSNLVATFNETVTVTASKVKLYNSDGTEIASSVTVVDNNKVTINPNTDLEVNKGYYVTIASDAVMDNDNNYFTGISGTGSWNFTTINPPDLTGLSPSDDASEVAVGSNLVATFNETVTVTASKVKLYNSDGTEIASSVTVVDNNKVTINPNTDLEVNKGYYVTIASDAVMDNDNNYFTGISGTGSWNFTTIAPPDLTGLSPSDDATEVTVGSNFVATFNETVTVTASKVKLYKSDGTEIASSVTVVDNNKVTINPNTDLEVNKGYYVTIASDAVMDSDNNYFTGISGTESWNFTTIDPPDLTGLSPSDDASEVAVGSNLVATFNETVTVTASKVKLYNSDGTEIASSVTVVDNNKVTINPNTDLEVNKGYYVTIASDAVMDNDNNYFTGISGTESWNFTTIDPPDLTGLSPSDDASEVAVDSNIVATFNETVSVTADKVKLYNSDGTEIASSVTVVDNNKVTINPNTDLEVNKGYYVTIASDAVMDNDNNYFTGISGTESWNFTTIDPPDLTGLSPTDDSSGVAVDSNLVATFNETVSVTADKVKLYKSDGTEIASSVTVLGNNKVTINPNTDLEVNKGYYVTIASDAVMDSDNNFFTGISGTGSWNFTTATE